MSAGEGIKVEKKNGVGIIRLNRPEALNILDTDMLRKLATIIGCIEDDKEVRAAIITGGKNFCAGADVRELSRKNPEEALSFAWLGQGVFDMIEDLGKPVIAAIMGYALGGGCEMALACDIRIAGESARIGQPEIDLGIIPGFGGTQRLTRLVGIGKAKEMILTGRVLEAREAGAIGLLNQVVKDEEVMKTAEDLALVMVRKSPLILGIAKDAINEGQDIKKALETEAAFFSECFKSEDHIEGINSFLEKRAPRFKGT